jgi:hypothetical protein
MRSLNSLCIPDATVTLIHSPEEQKMVTEKSLYGPKMLTRSIVSCTSDNTTMCLMQDKFDCKLCYAANATGCRVKITCRTTKFYFRAKLGTQNAKKCKTGFLHKILERQRILTFETAFHPGTQPLSEPQSADKPKSTLGDTKRQEFKKRFLT